MMERVLKRFLNLLILLITVGIVATFLSKPTTANEDGVPTLNWHNSQTTKKEAQTALIHWPSSNENYAGSIGLVVVDTSDPESISIIRDSIRTAHQNQDNETDWRNHLQMSLRTLPGTLYAWIGSPMTQRPRNDLSHVESLLTETRHSIEMTKKNNHDYELQTEVLAHDLTKQWSERLLRQSIDDTGTITVMRTQALQDLRLRRARAQISNAKTRLEGLSAIESARLDYLSGVNRLLNETSDLGVIDLLERHSVYQTPLMSDQPSP